jgi:hypothetical protein
MKQLYLEESFFFKGINSVFQSLKKLSIQNLRKNFPYYNLIYML